MYLASAASFLQLDSSLWIAVEGGLSVGVPSIAMQREQIGAAVRASHLCLGALHFVAEGLRSVDKCPKKSTEHIRLGIVEEPDVGVGFEAKGGYLPSVDLYLRKMACCVWGDSSNPRPIEKGSIEILAIAL